MELVQEKMRDKNENFVRKVCKKKKKRKFQPLIKRRTVSSKIEGRGESEVTSGRGMRKDTQMRQSLAALKMG